MWCKKCHNGHENYDYDHCGQCGCTEFLKKNPFEEYKKNQLKKKKSKKKYESSPKRRMDTTREDIEAITSGKLKPTPMR